MSSTAILLMTAFGSSVLSGVIGMGGGIILLSVMALYFPMAVLVPMHACVQLSSNFSRTFFHTRHIHVRKFAQYALGAALGSAVAALTLFAIPEAIYKMGLGCFILYLTFAPPFYVRANFRGKWMGIGLFTSVVSLYTGATGPLLAPFFLREPLSKLEIIGTKAACQGLTHLLKIISFAALGYSLRGQIPLLTAMIGAAIMGNYIGRWLLERIPDIWFFRIFKTVILILSLKMLGDGIHAIWLGQFLS